MITIPNEVLYSLNKFGVPKTLKGNDAIYALLVRLLLLEPGTIESHPNMGVGIVSRYRYSYEGEYRTLQSDIEDQITKYLPQFAGVKVNVTEKDKSYVIDFDIDETLYRFNYNTDNGTLETIRTT